MPSPSLVILSEARFLRAAKNLQFSYGLKQLRTLRPNNGLRVTGWEVVKVTGGEGLRVTING